MRILFVNSGLRFGGAETQLIALMLELKRQGHEVALFLLTEDAPRLGELTSQGVEVVLDRKKSKFDFAVLRRLRARIKSWAPAVVQGFLFDANVYARVAAVGCGVLVLNSERSSNYKLRRSQALAHYPTRCLADGVVANSVRGAAHAQRLFAFPDEKLDVVWNGVDFSALRALAARSHGDFRQEFFQSQDILLATLVGTISSPKDYLLALDVAAELLLRDPRWRVLFVGASFGNKLNYRNATASASLGYEAQVQAKYAQLEFKEKVVFAGQRSDAAAIIHASDVLFSTSIQEGFPNVILEAMALGVPVVSTEFSDIKDILPKAWQVVVLRDGKEIADAICRAKSESASLSEVQRLWVEANCSIETAAKKLLSVYKKYLAQ